MSGPHFEIREGDRAGVRAVMTTIDQQILQLAKLSLTGPGQQNGSVDQLRRSWAQLVNLIALGPAPQVRSCPVCKHIGMRAATRCGYCWTTLEQLTATTAEAVRAEAAHG